MDFFLCAQCLAQSRSSRDPIGIQSGSSRDPVGIQSGSSRDPVVNSSREFAPYWNSDEFVSKVQYWKRNHVEFFERNEFTTGRSPTQANKNEFPTGSRLGNVGLRLEGWWQEA